MEPTNLPDRYVAAALPAGPGRPALNQGTLGSNASGPDLRHIVTMFRRRIPVFLMIVALCMLLAINLTMFLPRVYQASADVLINKDRAEIVPGDKPGEQQDNAPLRAEEVDTETKVVLSRELADRVVTQLKLDHDSAFVNQVVNRGAGATLKRWIGIASTPMTDVRQALIDHLIAHLDATRLDAAYAIRISFRSSDPDRAAVIANAFAAGYAESAAKAKHAENEKTLAALGDRLEQLRSQAQGDYRDVQTFRIKHDLLSNQATALAEQETSAYAQELAQAKAGAALDQGRSLSADLAAESAAANSGAVQALRSQRAAVSAQVAQLSTRYLERHPVLISARQQLADLDAQIALEMNRAKYGSTTGLASSTAATSQQVSSLASSLSGARGKLARSNQALVGLNDLTRKADASQSLYENYLARYKEVLAQTGIEKAEARILSAATVPPTPVSPNAMLNLVLGALVGVLIGFAAAVAAEAAYDGLTTGDEVEQRLGVRYLGGVPLIASVGLSGADPAQTIIDQPGSAYAEAVRGLLAAVRQGNADRNQVIAVTSALNSEGKTSLSLSLARAAAQSGQTVIVIDCDTVQRGLSVATGTDSGGTGLREMMRSGAKLGEAMVRDGGSEAMILPITTAFADGERLLERGHFHSLIGALREHFAVIILDTAPILPIAETREIVALADNVVVSALWRKTQDAAVRAALRLLPLHVIGDIGVVLNRMDMRKQAKFGGGDAAYFYNHYKSYYTALPKA